MRIKFDCDPGVSKFTVSRVDADIDEDVTQPRERRLDGIPFVCLWLDASYLKVRENRRVVSKAVVIAIAVRGGRRTQGAPREPGQAST